jgi:hypothetical protein
MELLWDSLFLDKDVFKHFVLNRDPCLPTSVFFFLAEIWMTIENFFHILETGHLAFIL